MGDNSRNQLTQKSLNLLISQTENTTANQELDELRSLLLGIEPRQLNQLYERLNNPQIHAEDIGNLLPEAVQLQTQKNTQLVEAMTPTVEEAIKFSIQKDEKTLSEVIFPILAPATRKAITTALEQMIQSLNQTLEHSLSLQSWKWRLEAKRTGKTFAEVIMLRTLVYRVEQLFLIHKQTGLLLQHIVAPQVSVQDGELVSAMLTAIEDFVKDSFAVAKGDGLQSLQFGELTIWVEESPSTLLAGVIRGIPPQELRFVFQNAIAKIQLHLAQQLDDFQGETAPFAAAQPYLEDCLGVQYKKSASSKRYTYAWSLFGIVAIALGIWAVFAIQEQRRWHKYLAQLNSQPGIVVIKAERKSNGKYLIVGMRDPLAKNPQDLIKKASLPSEKVIGQWQSYISLDPQLKPKRAAEYLIPPKTTSLEIDNNGNLKASGVAPQKWIVRSRKLWRFIPGVNKYQDRNLTPSELAQFNTYKQQIEGNSLFFLEGKTTFAPGESKKLMNLVVAIKKIVQVSQDLQQSITIQIVGHTNTIGTEKSNKILSQARAQKMLSYFQKQGFKKSIFTAVGVGSSQRLPTRSKKENRISNRRVSFRVFLKDKLK
ncbi:OmpA family protein [Calothrix rhizosoleniae]|uniref:OmpA family protein n=1 Tax=Calothrix rhizosoleniae TaxID=888997 RepID=UPI000B4A31A4|nr:OmpA family protein [Calothrix rhizosoleniae]